jgi:hypothetical protein
MYPQVVAASAPVTLETVELTHNALPTLVSLWNSTANSLCHFISVRVSGDLRNESVIRLINLKERQTSNLS